MDNNEIEQDIITLESLTPKQTQALKLHIQGKTKEEICETLNLTQKTFEQWEASPEFNTLAKQQAHKIYVSALITTAIGTKEAVEILRHIIRHSESEKTQLAAIRLLLQTADLHLNEWSEDKYLREVETRKEKEKEKLDFELRRRASNETFKEFHNNMRFPEGI
ncbi:MAG: hypothetical protein KME46_32865 [Brasilonema angustatum HA4187-MV1]|jgi:hypothetical protein|nr:hypothetical protein [Brasilonema angustatum HA4187-MV1]